MKASVIDLGYNSLKLVSYEISSDEKRRPSFSVIGQKSIPARLGEGLSQTGFLGTEQIRRTIEGLKICKEVNEVYAIKQCLPIATSAVREAANRSQFLEQTFRETGFKFRVLSGREEALYSYSGAVRSLSGKSFLFFDLGGGSLEFVSGEGSKTRKILSLPLGGLRLTQLYAEKDGSYKEKSYSKLESRVWDLLPTKEEMALKGKSEVTLVGVGGTLRALVRWDQAQREYPFNKLHNYQLKRDALENMCKELALLKAQEIGEIAAIGRDRAETITAGALVVLLTMKKLGFSRLTVSTHGLRDGVLASFLENPVSYHQGKMGRSVLALRRNKEPLPPPASPLGNCLHSLESLGLIDSKELEILFFSLPWLLGSAATSRPEAFFYQIMDEESALSHREQLLAALSVAEARKQRSADWLYNKYRSMLKSGNKDTFTKLAAILSFLELMAKTGSRIRVSIADRGSKIKMNITSPFDSSKVPQNLLRMTLKTLAEKTDWQLSYAIRPRESPEAQQAMKKVGNSI